tara:strand:+ start:43 stop:441 length:399 start_codon:yes stop_codon:yes gene_type:complete
MSATLSNSGGILNISSGTSEAAVSAGLIKAHSGGTTGSTGTLNISSATDSGDGAPSQPNDLTFTFTNNFSESGQGRAVSPNSDYQYIRLTTSAMTTSTIQVSTWRSDGGDNGFHSSLVTGSVGAFLVGGTLA